jgi:hypothetical protein
MEAIDASVIFGSASRQNPAKKSRLALLTVEAVLKGIGSSLVCAHAGSPPAQHFLAVQFGAASPNICRFRSFAAK